MPNLTAKLGDRLEVLETLQHRLARSLLLARKLADDPVVGGEARGLQSRLCAIQAEVDLIAACSQARSSLADAPQPIPTAIWK